MPGSIVTPDICPNWIKLPDWFHKPHYSCQPLTCRLNSHIIKIFGQTTLKQGILKPCQWSYFQWFINKSNWKSSNMCFSVKIVAIFMGHYALHEKNRWHLCSALYPLQHTEVHALGPNAIQTSGLSQTSSQTRLVRRKLFLY